MCGAPTHVRFVPIADMDRYRVRLAAEFRKACSSDTPPHQNRLVFRLACSLSLDGSRVERVCSRRRCKQSVAGQQGQPASDVCGA